MTRHTPQHEVELYREGEHYVAIVELPGAIATDVDVEWIDGRLSVPKEIAPEGITARFDDGVLEVTLPIVGEERPDGLSIEVQDAE